MRAEAGQRTVIICCDAALPDQVRPVILSWATRITHTGPAASGHQIKLLMTFLAMSGGALYSKMRG